MPPYFSLRRTRVCNPRGGSTIGAGVATGEGAPFSDRDLQDETPGCRIIIYKDLLNVERLEDVLDAQGRLVLLYPVASDSDGHWVCGFVTSAGVFSYQDSYGRGPDGELGYARVETYGPLLTHLLNKFEGGFSYNRSRLQKKEAGINTCGRHVACRLNHKDLSDAAYLKIVGSDADAYVTHWTDTNATPRQSGGDSAGAVQGGRSSKRLVGGRGPYGYVTPPEKWNGPVDSPYRFSDDDVIPTHPVWKAAWMSLRSMRWVPPEAFDPHAAAYDTEADFSLSTANQTYTEWMDSRAEAHIDSANAQNAQIRNPLIWMSSVFSVVQSVYKGGIARSVAGSVGKQLLAGIQGNLAHAPIQSVSTLSGRFESDVAALFGTEPCIAFAAKTVGIFMDIVYEQVHGQSNAQTEAMRVIDRDTLYRAPMKQWIEREITRLRDPTRVPGIPPAGISPEDIPETWTARGYPVWFEASDGGFDVERANRLTLEWRISQSNRKETAATAAADAARERADNKKRSFSDFSDS